MRLGTPASCRASTCQCRNAPQYDQLAVLALRRSQVQNQRAILDRDVVSLDRLVLLYRDVVGLDPCLVRVEDRAAGSYVKLPAVPGAAQYLALPRPDVLARPAR